MGERTNCRIISRVLQSDIGVFNPPDVCLQGSTLAWHFLSSCFQKLGFPSSSPFPFLVWAEQTAAAATSLAGRVQGSPGGAGRWGLASRRHVESVGRWRRRADEIVEGAGKEGSSDSSRPTRLEEQTADRWEPFENWANQTRVPKANPSITRGTWTSITPCKFLRLHLLESSSSLGNQALFQCFSAL